MKQHRIDPQAYLVPLFLVLVMIVIQLIKPAGCYGIIPRYSIGLKGIILAPLFHSGWKHLFSNAFPIITLGFMVFTFYKELAYLLLIFGWILTGTLVWLFGDLGLFPSETGIGCHIGASGLVYVLASFVFWSGILRKSLPLIAVSLVVVFLYGGMIWGIFPEEFIRYTPHQNRISWESHAAGALIGSSFAVLWRKIGPQKDHYSLRKTIHDQQKDEILWQKYLDIERKKLGTDNPENHFKYYDENFNFYEEE